MNPPPLDPLQVARAEMHSACTALRNAMKPGKRTDPAIRDRAARAIATLRRLEGERERARSAPTSVPPRTGARHQAGRSTAPMRPASSAVPLPFQGTPA